MPLVLAVLLFLASLVSPAAGQERRYALDELLRWEEDGHGALGPTGRRVSVDRIEEGPGFLGVFNYIQATPGFVDPLVLDFDEPLKADKTVWHPSHLETRFVGEGLEVRERKFILQSDVLVTRVTVVNESPDPRDLEVRLQSGLTPLLERSGSKQFPLKTPGKVAEQSLRYDGLVFQVAKTGLEGPLSIPSIRPALGICHLLGKLSLAPTSAHLDLLLHDGSRVKIPWPSVDQRRADAKGRWSWRMLQLPQNADRLFMLSCEPPPGRFLEAVDPVEGEEGADLPLYAATLEVLPKKGRLPMLLGEPDFHGLEVHALLAGQAFIPGTAEDGSRCLIRSLRLEPHARETFTAILSFGPDAFPLALTAQDLVRDDEIFEKHLAAFHGWFDANVPAFTCSDPVLEKAWHYSWFLVRHTLVEPETPTLQFPVFLEGTRGDATWVTPRSTPHILSQVRWLRDPEYAKGQVRAFLMNPGPGGLFTRLRVNEQGPVEAHWIPAAAVGVFEVTGSMQFLLEVYPLLLKNLDASMKVFGKDPGAADFLRLSLTAMARAARVLKKEADAVRLEALGAELGTPSSMADPLYYAFGRDGIDVDSVDWPLFLSDLARPLVSGLSEEGALSSYCDLVIRFVGGLCPASGDTVVLNPRFKNLEHFSFQNLPYHGRRLDIIWDRPGGERVYPELEEGFTLRIDQRQAFHGLALERIRVPLDQAR